MAVTKASQRKAVVLAFTGLEGLNVSVARAIEGINSEVVSTPNTGTVRVLFNSGHHGEETITLTGSKAGTSVLILDVTLHDATITTGDGTVTVVGMEKAVGVKWGGQLHGADVILSIDGEEQSVTRNDGLGVAFVPWAATSVDVRVQASHQGHESATLPVT